MRTRKRAPARAGEEPGEQRGAQVAQVQRPRRARCEAPGAAHAVVAERQRVGDLRQPRRVAVAVGVEQLDVGGPARRPRRGRRSGSPTRSPRRSSSCTCRRSRRSRRARRSRGRTRPGCRAGGPSSSSSSNPSHSPNVGEPRRRSTTTSSTRPRATRTSLPWPGCVWKCSPRSVPRREREWLSCRNSVGTPSRRPGVGAVGLDEEAARVAVDRGSEQHQAGESGVDSLHRPAG